jgi:type I restriction enzyme S subunit
MKMQIKDIIHEYSVRNKNKKDYPVYSVTNSQGFCKDYFGKEVASKDKSAYKIVPYGCFAYNPSRINVGSIDWQHSEDFVIVSPLYNVFEVNTSIVKQEYLSYFFKSRLVFDYINTFAKGSVRLNIPLSTLGEFPVPVPPLSEQERIVSELELLSSIIEKKKEQLKEYDQLAQSIFYDMFGDPIENPKGWEVKKLGEECTDLKYGTSKPACDNGRYKYLRMGNISINGELDLTDLKTIDIPDEEVDKYLVRFGDILFNRTNSLDLIGKTCMFDLDEPMIIAGYIIRVKLSDSVSPRFIAKMFNLPSMKLLLKKMAKGAVNQANINSKELASIKIPLPPLPLQQFFAEKIEAIERQKELIKQSIAETEALFNSRMDYYFN